MWPRWNTIDDATMIGEEDGGLNKLKGQLEKALVHDSIELSELWHQSIAHVHYKELSMEIKALSELPYIQEMYEGIFEDKHKERMQIRHFPVVKTSLKEYWM